MHPNPVYRQAETDRNLAFARAQGFGTLAVSTEGTPLISHVPFVLDDTGTNADLHLVRSNPIARMLAAPQPACLAITGPQGYISPDWYGVEDQVPTWNYVAVHLRGTLELRPQEDLRAHLDDLSAAFEARLAPKTPWVTDKMTPEVLDRMMRQIVPVRLTVVKVDGTWKLGQNKPDAARIGGAEGLARSEIGQETAALSALMRDPPA